MSYEAVAPAPCQQGHAAAPCVGVPGAAASLVSFMRLFGGHASLPLQDRLHLPDGKPELLARRYFSSVLLAKGDEVVLDKMDELGVEPMKVRLR